MNDDEYGRVMLGPSQYAGSQPLGTNQQIKLTELNPRWCVEGAGRRGMAVGFDCPIHRTHRLVVAFANPIDNGPPMSGQRFLWNRQGETFDTLTLGPSVDASSHANTNFDMVQSPCWHGFIRNGYCE